MTRPPRHLNDRVGLIFDNTDLAQALKECLEMEGYSVRFCYYPHEKFECAASWLPGVIVTRLELLPSLQEGMVNASSNDHRLSKVPILAYSSTEKEIFKTSISSGFKIIPCETNNLLEEILCNF